MKKAIKLVEAFLHKRQWAILKYWWWTETGLLWSYVAFRNSFLQFPFYKCRHFLLEEVNFDDVLYIRSWNVRYVDVDPQRPLYILLQPWGLCTNYCICSPEMLEISWFSILPLLFVYWWFNGQKCNFMALALELISLTLAHQCLWPFLKRCFIVKNLTRYLFWFNDMYMFCSNGIILFALFMWKSYYISYYTEMHVYLCMNHLLDALPKSQNVAPPSNLHLQIWNANMDGLM